MVAIKSGGRGVMEKVARWWEWRGGGKSRYSDIIKVEVVILWKSNRVDNITDSIINYVIVL